MSDMRRDPDDTSSLVIFTIAMCYVDQRQIGQPSGEAVPIEIATAFAPSLTVLTPSAGSAGDEFAIVKSSAIDSSALFDADLRLPERVASIAYAGNVIGVP